ncbi:DegV domain-containing protein SAV1425 [Anaerococcus prevotii]|uniref:DegV family protein n=1 Tax=Anaerococcus prevotii (strain ATCC 9321 / DSM 20548 / JCM 6508 / NCTC 11806 / PC1) TaxID=525919 RepID=C7RHX7_ANAPD|nr:DegV family protein [Anaerococcus prevotii]ACV29088.1 degV family protein [Anaerococcus prevotii DSM 20548]SUU94762.1 DegV domain-containing protein SAV1425 [Anaerococcus prevotii]
MSDYIISSESIMDLSAEYVKEIGVSFIKSNYELNGEIYLDDFGQSLDMEEFYRNMEEGAAPSTAAINTQAYLDYFEEILKKDMDIIHVCLSSGLTTQYSCLLQAVDILKEKFPERKIYPIDSKMASSGVGLLVDKLVMLKNEGMSIEDLYKWAKENTLHVISYTSNENLEYVARGGRISKTAANIGNLLKICPLIEIDDEGHMQVTQKVRTKKKLLKTLVDRMEKNAIGGLNYNDKLIISHASNEKTAKELRDMMADRFKEISAIDIFEIGPTIGSHIGPGAITMFYWGEKRLG